MACYLLIGLALAFAGLIYELVQRDAVESFSEKAKKDLREMLAVSVAKSEYKLTPESQKDAVRWSFILIHVALTGIVIVAWPLIVSLVAYHFFKTIVTKE